MNRADGSETRKRRDGDASGNGDLLSPDHKDAEIGRLRRQLREWRTRGERATAEAAALRERIVQFTEASKSFSRSMRVRAYDRERFKRRLVAQYAVGRVLAGTGGIDDVAPKVFAIFADELGWHLGFLWKLDEGSKMLRCGGAWRVRGKPPSGAEEASRHTTFARRRATRQRLGQGRAGLDARPSGGQFRPRKPVEAEDLMTASLAPSGTKTGSSAYSSYSPAMAPRRTMTWSGRRP